MTAGPLTQGNRVIIVLQARESGMLLYNTWPLGEPVCQAAISAHAVTGQERTEVRAPWGWRPRDFVSLVIATARELC